MKMEFTYKMHNGKTKKRKVTLDKLADFTLQNGNMKLKDTDKEVILDWSILGEAERLLIFRNGYYNEKIDFNLCPYATIRCIETCYNLKASYMFDNIIDGRLSNLLFTLDSDFTDRMIKKLHGKLKFAKRHGRRVVVRIHVDGEWYSLEYMKKWFAIAEALPEIRFFTYTKSFDYLLQVDSIPSNLNIMLSIFDDIDAAELEKAYELNKIFGLKFFYSGDLTDKLPEHVTGKAKECKGADCLNCRYCIHGHQMVHTPIH